MTGMTTASSRAAATLGGKSTLPSRHRPEQAPAVVVNEHGTILTIDDREDWIDDFAAPGGSIRIHFDGGETVFIERPLQCPSFVSKRDALTVEEKVDLEALSCPVAQGKRLAGSLAGRSRDTILQPFPRSFRRCAAGDLVDLGTQGGRQDHEDRLYQPGKRPRE